MKIFDDIPKSNNDGIIYDESSIILGILNLCFQIIAPNIAFRFVGNHPAGPLAGAAFVSNCAILYFVGLLFAIITIALHLSAKSKLKLLNNIILSPIGLLFAFLSIIALPISFFIQF